MHHMSLAAGRIDCLVGGISQIQHAKDQVIRYLSIFSDMGPVGVAIGMAVNEFAAPIVDSIMLAIVAGTFVNVGATEVIPEEWEDSQHKWKKFAALMSGIVSIFCITPSTQCPLISTELLFLP
jgi:zinc transporter ZupT